MKMKFTFETTMAAKPEKLVRRGPRPGPIRSKAPSSNIQAPEKYQVPSLQQSAQGAPADCRSATAEARPAKQTNLSAPRRWTWFFLAIVLAVFTLNVSHAQQGEINITNTKEYFGQKPVPVSLDGFTGEAAEVLKFDLYVQGFSFVTPDAAQYLIKGSSADNVAGSLTDKFANKMLLSRSYSGASVRRQAHAFADEIVGTIRTAKPIGQTKIAFKIQPTSYGPGEIYVADFDGYGAQQVTSDGAIVAKPAWVPGRMALYYTSYARNNMDIFYHNLSSGQRHVIAGHSGENTGAAVSPDGSRVAMILSKSGSPNVWVCNADGTDLKRVTTGVEDSSPCWSPDGEWICLATKFHERRRLAKVPAGGGEVQYLTTTGAANPTEPDWSPDGKWIVFTSQMGDFSICVMPADGSMPPAVLVAGQNPSWAPNSRTLVFNHGPAGRQTLAVLDVFTRQYKDCHRATGNSSQPAWAR
jgi:TolB protein